MIKHFERHDCAVYFRSGCWLCCALCFGWRIALVAMACILDDRIWTAELRVVTTREEKTKKAHEGSSQMACEAAAAIRTVASLTREDDCALIFSRGWRVLGCLQNAWHLYLYA